LQNCERHRNNALINNEKWPHVFFLQEMAEERKTDDAKETQWIKKQRKNHTISIFGKKLLIEPNIF